jgi:thiol-disulfide isomerase/thioredoxin
MRRLLVLGSLLLLAAPAGAQQAASPWIGIAIEEGAQGVMVKKVIEHTPGERAGLAAGDEVIAIDGHKVQKPGELVEFVLEKGVGEKVALTYLRGGKQLSATMALEPRPDELELLRSRLVGKKAPAFTLEAFGPHPAKSDALTGEVVVVEFWATWCGPCNTTMPRLSAWQERYGKLGLRVVGVSTEPLALLHKHVAGRNVSYTIAHDEGTMSDAYDVPAVPTFVVIDRGGTVRYVDVGAGSRVDAVEAAFLPLLGK